MAKTIHSMIRVFDEARSVAFYDAAFGLKVADRLDFESFTLIYLSNPDQAFELELTVNKGRTEPYNLGDGYGHIAFEVPDVVDAQRAVIAAGGSSIGEIVTLTRSDGWQVTLCYAADPEGNAVELLTWRAPQDE